MNAMDLERALLGVRPRNSPGWGMLAALKTGAYTSERDPSERTTITAGTTRVSPDYWLAVERPELFRPIDKRDGRTYAMHSRNLERAREELERGLPAARRSRSERHAGPPIWSSALSLPGQPFRLPRSDKPFKLPRRRPAKVLP